MCRVCKWWEGRGGETVYKISVRSHTCGVRLKPTTHTLVVGAHTPATRPEEEMAARRDKDLNSVRRRHGAAVGELECFIFHFVTGRAESESPVSPPAIFSH